LEKKLFPDAMVAGMIK